MKFLSNYFVNPFSVIIATVFTFINFLVILLPFYLLIIPLILQDKEAINFSANMFVYIMIFMFIFTIIYLFVDMFFGFTLKNITQDCILIEDDDKDFKLYKQVFNETLEKFDLKNVELLLKSSDEVNAFAIFSFRKKYVIITSAMIDHISNTYSNLEEQKNALRGLIAHELSHLLNWDSLPNIILLSGQNVAYYLSLTLTTIMDFIITIFSYIPVTAIFALIFRLLFLGLNWALVSFYNFILYPIYLFIERFLGRLVEYRSDYQSAQALSWEPMYACLYSLMMLDGNTYHSNFSTHPNTISRILNIYKAEKSLEIIEASFFTKYFSILFVSFFSAWIFYFSYLYFDQIEIISQLLEKFIIESYYYTINSAIYLYESKLYIVILLSIITLYFTVKIFNKVALNYKLKNLSDTLNTNENTDIDFLLLYAIENNDIHSFINILKAGANINSTLFKQSIDDFIKETNPKFATYITTIKEKN